MTFFRRARRTRKPKSRGAAVSLAETDTERLAIEALRAYPGLMAVLSELGDDTEESTKKGNSLMSSDQQLFERWQKFLSGTQLSLEDEHGVIEEMAARDPACLQQVCRLLANQKRDAQEKLSEACDAHRQAENQLAVLQQGPWFPADVLRVYADGRLEVACNGRRQVIAAVPELGAQQWLTGDEVLLDRELRVVVARSDAPQRTGMIGTVAEIAGSSVIVRGNGDEEIVAFCPAELVASLRVDDRVLYRRDAQCVLARLAPRTQSAYTLEQPPRTRFEDIGGLDHVIAEIRRDLDLHLLHPDVAGQYRLRLVRGMVLVGPPGTGKTMLAGSIANYLRDTDPSAHFLHVKPGALRHVYYGSTEARIRELFAVARRAPGLVVIFFDELDTFGARGASPGHTLDDRVMGCLLSEIDGIEPTERIVCVAATNRLDLCDDALVREGRLKDRIYHIPRPNRLATRQILTRYVRDDLPYAAGAEAAVSPETVVDAAVAYLFAEHDSAGPIVTVTLANGTRHEIRAPAVLSGALLAGAVERAKHVAAHRHLSGEPGLAVEDVLMALDQALSAEADKLQSPAAARRILDFPGADDIVRVELPQQRQPRRYRYLRVA